jgi:hypothetical protein
VLALIPLHVIAAIVLVVTIRRSFRSGSRGSGDLLTRTDAAPDLDSGGL